MRSRKQFIRLVIVLLISLSSVVAMATQGNHPSGLVPPIDEYDWLQLTSDEWLKCELVSLSHVALPIPLDDPLYGQHFAQNSGLVFLGDLAVRGEQGLLKIPAEWLLRLRYNPFYTYLQKRVLQWVDNDEAP